MTFAAMLITFGQDSGVARYFYENENTEVRKQIISESFFFQLFLLIIPFTLSIVNINSITYLFKLFQM